ncbi:uncharacterized protein [Branchiostoma lanceolatum]|uniref:uncharacterized protein n=1 Tax=Branchiostoma lanceolatum TaxID=7740 RepID=UPI0034527308
MICVSMFTIFSGAEMAATDNTLSPDGESSDGEDVNITRLTSGRLHVVLEEHMDDDTSAQKETGTGTNGAASSDDSEPHPGPPEPRYLTIGDHVVEYPQSEEECVYSKPEDVYGHKEEESADDKPEDIHGHKEEESADDKPDVYQHKAQEKVSLACKAKGGKRFEDTRRHDDQGDLKGARASTIDDILRRR